MENRHGNEVRLGRTPLVHGTAQVLDSELGAYTQIEEGCVVLESVLGDYSYLCRGCDVAYAELGRFVSVAAQVRIGPTNHPMGRVTQHHFTYRSGQYGFGPDDAQLFEWRRQQRTRVGHDVWLGHGAIVLPGVVVGTGAVVGAGAVVTRDVADYAIVAGVPARTVRERFDQDVCDRLLALAWWDWEHDRLGSALADFRDLPVERFLDKYEF